MHKSEAVELFRVLSEHPVFGPCHPQLLHALLERSSQHSDRRGTSIARATEQFPFLGMVLAGVLAVTVSGDGPSRGVHRLELYEAAAGAIFGEVAFFEEAPPPGDIVVVSKHATYALFPAAAINEAISADRKLLRRLAVHVAGRARSIAQRVIAPQGFSAASRVASVLLRFSAEGEGLKPARPELTGITQRDIAAAAACVKESAARAITALESAGALRRERGHIRYLDYAILYECATGSAITGKHVDD